MKKEWEGWVKGGGRGKERKGRRNCEDGVRGEGRMGEKSEERKGKEGEIVEEWKGREGWVKRGKGKKGEGCRNSEGGGGEGRQEARRFCEVLKGVFSFSQGWSRFISLVSLNHRRTRLGGGV